MTQRSVFFATPSYDCTVSVEHHGSIVTATQFLNANGIETQVGTINGCCFVDRARCRLVKAFLQTDCTDLFFVDADIGFDYKVLPRFLESPHEILVGIPPKRKTEAEYHVGGATNALVHGAFEAKEVPTAFMRIKREVFEKLDEAYPEIRGTFDPKLDEAPPYFQCGIYHGNFLGEDIFFCRLWTALGNSVWVDADVNFEHRGSHSFKGNCFKHWVSTQQITLKEPSHAAGAD